MVASEQTSKQIIKMETQQNIQGDFKPIFSQVLTVVGGRVIASRPMELTNLVNHNKSLNFRGQDHFGRYFGHKGEENFRDVAYLTIALDNMEVTEEEMDIEVKS